MLELPFNDDLYAAMLWGLSAQRSYPESRSLIKKTKQKKNLDH